MNLGSPLGAVQRGFPALFGHRRATAAVSVFINNAHTVWGGGGGTLSTHPMKNSSPLNPSENS